MRIAFLSPEYPTEHRDAGGLATYVQRMARALLGSGHETEVFVASVHRSGTLADGDVTVHRTNWTEQVRLPPCNRAIPWLMQASALSSTLERRHAAAPFDLVQSADLNATGLFVRRRPGRPHVVRCSSAADLYNAIDHRRSLVEPFRAMLERRAIRQADVAYAPSRYIADHFARMHGIDLRVIRPPAYPEAPAGPDDAGLALPERFLLHFGQLIARKGTEVLARALPLAWAEAPELTMVWTGSHASLDDWRRWRGLWGAQSGWVLATGPLPRARLHAVLRRAEASVLPSLVDNLPNTVIESLMCGVPVVGSRGASIDELVEDGVTGQLVELGDARDLAAALVRVWRGQTPVRRGFAWRPPADMTPEQAVSNVLALAHA
ncbi:MAG TPA: glycosyltransferase family 4 protein [Caulobacteraceae bacterium]|nr:glycosyltransferase family 4 protein [Caulobacteraceae bacterium]